MQFELVHNRGQVMLFKLDGNGKRIGEQNVTWHNATHAVPYLVGFFELELVGHDVWKTKSLN